MVHDSLNHDRGLLVALWHHHAPRIANAWVRLLVVTCVMGASQHDTCAQRADWMTTTHHNDAQVWLISMRDVGGGSIHMQAELPLRTLQCTQLRF